MRPEIFTVPDADDLGIKTDPLKVRVKTPDGDPVRPIVVLAAVNREARRREIRAAEKARKQAKEPAPLYVSKPPPPRNVNQEMADMVIKEWEVYHGHFPLKTLQDYLDDRTAETLEAAWKAGKPLNRDDVRRALANLHNEALRERN